MGQQKKMFQFDGEIQCQKYIQKKVYEEKMDMKAVIKAIAPYISVILMGIGVYADNHTKSAMLEYRLSIVEKDKDALKDDLKSIKDLLYSIDTRLSIFGVQLEERTGSR